jgi:hypothetical protein
VRLHLGDEVVFVDCVDGGFAARAVDGEGHALSSCGRVAGSFG